MLTPNFFATSPALTSCRIGRTSTATAGKRFPCSIPFTCCMLPSVTPDRSPCLYLWKKARSCQTITLNSLSKTSGGICKDLQGPQRRSIRGEQAILARRGLGAPSAFASRNFRTELCLSGAAELTAPRVQIEAVCLAALLGFDRGAGDLGVEGGDGGTQALRDHLRIMLESSLRIRVPE